jgi:hypothetical protein
MRAWWCVTYRPIPTDPRVLWAYVVSTTSNQAAKTVAQRHPGCVIVEVEQDHFAKIPL